MNRLSFSRQPSVYVGLAAAVLVTLTTIGLRVPDGLEAAIDGLIVALGAAVTWTQVRPAKHSFSPEETRSIAARAVETYAGAAEVRAKSKADLAPTVPIKAHPKTPVPAKKAAKKR